MLPKRITFIRHGESELNAHLDAEKAGLVTDAAAGLALRSRPDHAYRLTEKGIAQATDAGKKFHAHRAGVPFPLVYVSPYKRTIETARNVLTPFGESTNVLLEPRIAERSWGQFGSLPRSEAQKVYAETAEQRKADPIWGPMPGGERMFETCLRVQSFIQSLDHLTELGIDDVLMVAHGDVMAALRIVMEGFDPGSPLIHKTDRRQKIGNCDVLEYITEAGAVMPTLGRLVHLGEDFEDVSYNRLDQNVISRLSTLDALLEQ